MNSRPSSPRFRFSSSAILLVLLALVLPALREGNGRLWMLAAVVPSALLLAVTLLARMFSLDRMTLSLTLTLCSLGIAALAFTDPDRAFSHSLCSAAGLAALLAGAGLARSLRPTLLVSGGAAFLGLLLLISGTLSLTRFSLTEAALVFLLIAFASLLASGKSFAALLPGIAGTALLLAQREPVPALLWSLTFLLLFWAADGSLLLLAAGTLLVLLAGAAAVVWGKVPLPRIQNLPAPYSGLLISLNAGVPGTGSVSLLSLLTDCYGPLFSGLSAMLFLPLVLRGASVAGSCRSRFHAVLSMGCALLTLLYVLPALLSEFGVLPFRTVPLPLFSASPAELCPWMFLQGMVCGIAGRNDADLADDVHLAMLSK